MGQRRKHGATARCHCGKVEIEITTLPTSITECNCSICRRYGAMWAYFRRHEVILKAEPGSLALYSWGDRTIEFYHCTNCGCISHYESTAKQDSSRFAVNARMLPAEVSSRAVIRHFDGAESWKYLD